MTQKEYKLHLEKCPHCDFTVKYEIEAEPYKIEIDQIRSDIKIRSEKKMPYSEEQIKHFEKHITQLKTHLIPKGPAYANHRKVMMREHIKKEHIAQTDLQKIKKLKELELKYSLQLQEKDATIIQLQEQLVNAKSSLKEEILTELLDEATIVKSEAKSKKQIADAEKRIKLLEKQLADAKANAT